MKKLITLLFLFSGIVLFAAPPMKGGYLGKRIIVAGEFAYSPNYLTVGNFLLSYNPQFGGNIQFVTGRYWQIGVNYNRYMLSNHEKYEEFDLNESEKINGTLIGITFRKYRVKKGGLAPIGKFIEFGLSQNTARLNYKAISSSYKDEVVSTRLYASTALGVQHIWNDFIIWNAGVRVGYTFMETGSSTSDVAEQAEDYVMKRMIYHSFFNPFAGVGVIF